MTKETLKNKIKNTEFLKNHKSKYKERVDDLKIAMWVLCGIAISIVAWGVYAYFTYDSKDQWKALGFLMVSVFVGFLSGLMEIISRENRKYHIRDWMENNKENNDDNYTHINNWMNKHHNNYSNSSIKDL